MALMLWLDGMMMMYNMMAPAMLLRRLPVLYTRMSAVAVLPLPGAVLHRLLEMRST
jgi:hypothetical protein